MGRRTFTVAGCLALLTLGGCVGSGAPPMGCNRELRQGDALGMFIGHAVNERTIAQRQQANPTQPTVANVPEGKTE